MKYAILFFVVLCSLMANAQRGQGDFLGSISGQAIDSLSNSPMEYVTVSIFRLRDKELVSGGITDTKGKFEISELIPGRYSVELTYLGYNVSRRNVVISPRNGDQHLGKIMLTANSETLNTATVVGSARKVIYDIDKRVVNVADLNTVMSESATEILQNVPGVSVDLDGNVSLRGSSNFTLLIDGKPTVLDVADALQQIPASTIQSIEIITNPSVKYEAEGVSGIVNIVMKRNKLEGVSGMFNGNIGTYDNYGSNMVLSINEKKVTFNVRGHFRTRGRPSFEESTRTTTRGNRVTELFSQGDEEWNHGGYGLNGELIYRPDKKNTLGVGGQIGNHSMESITARNFIQSDRSTNPTSPILKYSSDMSWNRDGSRNSVNANYSHMFKANKEHRLDLRGVMNFRDGEEYSQNKFLNQAGAVESGNILEEIGPNNMIRANLDYKRPLGNKKRLETGLQYQHGVGADETRSFDFVPSEGKFVQNESLSYTVDYVRNIYAAYAMFRGKQAKLGYQLGLRGEYTDRVVDVVGFEPAEIERMDYFPTIHFSYDVKEDVQTLLSYSRRIQRPRAWHLEPFTTWRDAFNARSGNPNLQPEYIDAYEASVIKDFSKTSSLSIELYHRRQHNNIERIQSSLDSNTVVRFPINVGEAINSGVELAANHLFSKKWKSDFSSSFYDYRVIGEYEGQTFDQQSFSYQLRWNNTFIFENARIQVEQRYQSRIVTAQGERNGFWTANASWKQSFMKKRLSTTLQIRDIFSTTINKNSVVGDFFESFNISEPRTPTVALSVSLKLNNYNQRMGRGAGDSDDDL